uniref:Uncharacterized protein n=2 Tax=Anguilla anguilla TaxID=7936 RepID=A0A0E9QV27_ANGAN
MRVWSESPLLYTILFLNDSDMLLKINSHRMLLA